MIKKMNISNSFLSFGFLLLSISVFCNHIVFINGIINEIKILSLLSFFISILFKMKNLKLSRKKCLAYICLTIASIISFFVTQNIIVAETVLMLIASTDVDFKKIVKADFVSKIITILLVIISYELGLTNEMHIHRADGLYRYSLGFQHPNTLALVSLFTYIDYIILRGDAVCKKDIIIGIFTLIIMLLLTDSRATAIVFAFFIMSLLFRKSIKKIIQKKSTLKISSVLFLLLGIISIFTTICYDDANPIMNSLNEISSNRLQIQHSFYSNYGLSFFGHTIDYSGIYSLDSFYVRYILNFGIFGFLLFALLYYGTIKKAYREKNNTIAMVFIIIAFYCLMENLPFCIEYGVYVLYLVTKNLEKKDEYED